MRRLTVVLAALLAAAPVAALELKDIHRKASESVVALKLFDASGQDLGEGSGFAVEGDRIVTNCHVATDALSITAIVAPDTRIEILAVLACDEVNDLAVLKPAVNHLAPLALATSAAEPGERVVVLGNPLGLSGTLSEGIVAAIRTEGVDPGGPDPDSSSPRIQITAPISPGSSGSPVMNLDGNVVGVAVSGYVYGQNLNFAVPASALALVLRGAGGGAAARALAPVSSGRNTYIRNVVISLAFFGLVAFLLRRAR